MLLGAAVNPAMEIYSKAGSSRNCAQTPDNGQWSQDTVYDLFTDFVCEYGPAERSFDYNDPITLELALSRGIGKLRAEFYNGNGAHLSGIGQMGPAQFIDGKVWDMLNGSVQNTWAGITGPTTVSDFLGGYNWYIRPDMDGGLPTVRFEIENTTDLASGTRIGFSRQGVQDISLQDYLNNPQRYNKPGPYSFVVSPTNFDYSKYNIISVLSPRSSSLRSPGTTGPGGGTMRQTFTWEELLIPSWMCGDYDFLPLSGPLRPAKPG